MMPSADGRKAETANLLYFCNVGESKGALDKMDRAIQDSKRGKEKVMELQHYPTGEHRPEERNGQATGHIQRQTLCGKWVEPWRATFTEQFGYEYCAECLEYSRTTNTTQHTPTPLKLDEANMLLNGCIDVLTPRDTVFATCYSVEDAAYIVRAVNAHEALVTTLQGLLDILDDSDAWCCYLCGEGATHSNKWDMAIAEARAALKLAEGANGKAR